MYRIKILFSILVAVSLISSCAKRDDAPLQDKDEARLQVIKISQPGSITVDGDDDDWKALGISPLQGLDWKVKEFGKIKDAEPQRIKAVSMTHDGENLFLLLMIDPGIEEFFQREQRSGHIGYLFIDVDGDESTGTRIDLENKYSGWDCRIYLPTGFAGRTDSMEVRPIAEYKIEKIARFNLEKNQYGYSYSCDYEDIADGNRDSQDSPTHISFKDDFLELRLPFEILGMTVPTEVRLLVEDLSSIMDSAEVQIHVVLEDSP